MSEQTIEVHPRAETGKNVNRRLRASGQVPAVVYGGDRDALTIRVDHRAVEDLLRSASGENTVFLLKLAGTESSRHAMIRELQTDPIRGSLVHIDFQRIDMSERVNVDVPIELHGEAEGVKVQGGMVDFVTRQVEVSCLPSDIPPHLELDITALEIGDHVEAGQLELPPGVELLDDATRVIVSITQARLAAEETEEEEELLEAAQEQPEVIGEQEDAAD